VGTVLMLRPRGMKEELKEERERAYSLAREQMLRARSRAVFELLSGLGNATSPADVRARLRAADLVREGVRLPRQSTSPTDALDYLGNDYGRDPTRNREEQSVGGVSF
jgi:hypothetical protein